MKRTSRFLLIPLAAIAMVLGLALPAQAAAPNPTSSTNTIIRDCSTFISGHEIVHTAVLTYAINSPDSGQYQGVMYPRHITVQAGGSGIDYIATEQANWTWYVISGWSDYVSPYYTMNGYPTPNRFVDLSTLRPVFQWNVTFKERDAFGNLLGICSVSLTRNNYPG